MLYVARRLFMPWGEERYSQMLDVCAGKVRSIVSFEKELPAMSFVDEVYVTSCDNAIVVSDIKIEIHHAGGSLYAYSADKSGILTRLL